jgi:hypothetical protein
LPLQEDKLNGDEGFIGEGRKSKHWWRKFKHRIGVDGEFGLHTKIVCL